MKPELFNELISQLYKVRHVFLSEEEYMSVKHINWELVPAHLANARTSTLKIFYRIGALNQRGNLTKYKNPTSCSLYANEESDLALDDCSEQYQYDTTVGDSSCAESVVSVQCQMHIVLHATYCVPAAYTRMCYEHSNSAQQSCDALFTDCTNKVLDVREAQEVVDHLQQHTNKKFVRGKDDFSLSECQDVDDSNALYDHSHHLFGTLDMDMHPQLDTPFLSLHSCQVRCIIRDALLSTLHVNESPVIQSLGELDAKPNGDNFATSQFNSIESTANTHNDEYARDSGCSIHYSTTYMLAWLSLTGPHFGLSISPTAYLKAYRCLNHNK